MRLKQLELTGFKSFAKKSVFEFKTPTTGVVGPNGSGKSNIVEAIRFVLGEQSMKSLRSKRGDDLIFNGSRTIPRLNRAKVSITFDNTDHIFGIDYDEIEIERVVYRDATNEYLLNGAPTRLKDIIELLASVHVGSSGHHIISQGEADRILSASIKERRSMIEDALGLKIFELKRAESERKLKKTEENVGQVKALRQEIAPHLRFLEKQVEKIRQAEELRGELGDMYARYLFQEKRYLEAERKRLEDEKSVPRTELSKTEEILREKEASLRKLEKEKDTNAETRRLENELQTLRNKKDELSRSVGRLEGILEYEARREKEESRGEGTLSVNIRALKTFIAFVRESIANAHTTDDVLSLKSILKKIEESAHTFWETHGAGSLTTQSARGGINKEEYADTKRKKEETEQLLTEIQEQEKKLREEYFSVKDRAEQGHSTWRKLESELFELRTRKNELLTRLELIAVRFEKIENEEQIFKGEVEEAKRHVGAGILEIVHNLPPAERPEEKELRGEQERRRQKIERLKIKIEEIGSGGEETLKEYNEARERDQFLEREITDLEKSALSLKELIQELAEKIDTEFKEGIHSINKHFQDFFSLMFGGGKASIKVIAPQKKKKISVELMDEESSSDLASSLDEEPEEGIDIAIELPTKRLKGLQSLSGGERALTSIALIFATTLVHPPPFLVLDETDAALDEANSKKFGALLERLSEKTQFIVITHNRETMGKAGVLYGVTAAHDGVSKVLSIQLEKAVEMAE